MHTCTNQWQVSTSPSGTFTSGSGTSNMTSSTVTISCSCWPRPCHCHHYNPCQWGHSLQHCQTCDVVYCGRCHKEWGGSSFTFTPVYSTGTSQFTWTHLKSED